MRRSRPNRANARWGGTIALCALLFVAVSAGAQTVVTKRGLFEERDGQLTATVGFREMFGEQLKKRLRSGFASSVVMRVFLYPKAGGRPMAATARTLRAVYDLWDEKYLLSVEERGKTYHQELRDEKELVDRLTSFWRLPLVPISQISKKEMYFVAAIVEVNPMQAEVLAEVRRWLRTPYRRHSQMGGESFFGSFVSIFINNKIRRAESTFKVRTQLFYRP